MKIEHTCEHPEHGTLFVTGYYVAEERSSMYSPGCEAAVEEMEFINENGKDVYDELSENFIREVEKDIIRARSRRR